MQIPKMLHPHMDFIFVVGMAISKEAFYEDIVKVPERLAYILCPPLQYSKLMELVLYHSLNTMLAVLQEPHKDSCGNLDMKVINYAMRVYKTLHPNLRFGSAGEKGKEGEETESEGGEGDDKEKKLEEYMKMIESQRIDTGVESV